MRRSVRVQHDALQRCNRLHGSHEHDIAGEQQMPLVIEGIHSRTDDQRRLDYLLFV
jgi:hypothetical protein